MKEYNKQDMILKVETKERNIHYSLLMRKKIKMPEAIGIIKFNILSFNTSYCSSIYFVQALYMQNHTIQVVPAFNSSCCNSQTHSSKISRTKKNINSKV